MLREPLKREITALLERADHEGLAAFARKRSKTVRLLVSMTYDKAGLLGWRAIEAIGRITEGWPAEKTRNLIQRLLWMMREESGTNAWSAGEIISEMVGRNPEPFEDIVPIVISFHEERILRSGALWCMIRVGEIRPDLVAPFAHIALRYLDSEDPGERGLALLALKSLGMREHLPAVEKKVSDEAMFCYYDGTSMRETLVRVVAVEAAAALGN
jgi:methylated-DNA-[protein]-cysteine S-methyltransferase